MTEKEEAFVVQIAEQAECFFFCFMALCPFQMVIIQKNNRHRHNLAQLHLFILQSVYQIYR